MVDNQGNTHGAAQTKVCTSRSPGVQSASPSKRGLTVVRVLSGSLNGPVLTQANLTSLLHHKHKNGTGSRPTHKSVSIPSSAKRRSSSSTTTRPACAFSISSSSVPSTWLS